MNLANPVQIDVIAHHEMQLQGCISIVEQLRKRHGCNILLGQDAQPTGADVAILIDHCAFQPKINKKNYGYIIHMSHDLADFNVYPDEKDLLKGTDLFLVPGQKHYDMARKTFPGTPAYPIGWPKFDMAAGVEVPPNHRPSRPDQKVVIYSPTLLFTREWEEVLPALLKTGHLIILKNHVHYNFEAGDPPPLGCEEEYALAIKSLLDMEAWIKSSGFENHVVVNRRSNICDLFGHADILVTDVSSSAMEFLPFGPSIETGRFGFSKSDAKAIAANYSSSALFLPVDPLKEKLAEPGWINSVVEAHKARGVAAVSEFIFQPPISTALYGTELIDTHLFLWQNGMHVQNIDYMKTVRGMVEGAQTITNKIRNKLGLH